MPHLYLWKSAKWIQRLELLDRDQLGFWERNGYHHRGDPWQQERYSVDDYGARTLRRGGGAAAGCEEPNLIASAAEVRPPISGPASATVLA